MYLLFYFDLNIFNIGREFAHVNAIVSELTFTAPSGIDSFAFVVEGPSIVTANKRMNNIKNTR